MHETLLGLWAGTTIRCEQTPQRADPSPSRPEDKRCDKSVSTTGAAGRALGWAQGPRNPPPNPVPSASPSPHPRQAGMPAEQLPLCSLK